MTIKWNCPCGKRLRAPDGIAGKLTRCTGCRLPQRIPGTPRLASAPSQPAGPSPEESPFAESFVDPAPQVLGLWVTGITIAGLLLLAGLAWLLSPGTDPDQPSDPEAASGTAQATTRHLPR